MKALSEAEGILAWQEIGQQWESNYYANDFGAYLVTIQHEFLKRFPNSERFLDVKWRTAYRKAVTPKSPISFGTEDFRSLLENALNAGEVHPGNLDAWLRQRKFRIAKIETSSKLLDNNQPAIALIIETDDRSISYYSLFVITGTRSGHYHVLSLRGRWQDTFYIPQPEMTVVDRNGNQRSEVQVIETSFGIGNSGCVSLIYLYGWRGDSLNGAFVDLAKDITEVRIGYDYGDCEKPWEFGPADASGAQPIIAFWRIYNHAGSECPPYERWISHIWAGQSYQRFSEGVVPFGYSGSLKCAVGWANWAGGLSDETIALLATALQNWSKDIDEQYGPAAQDFFRFKLGVWYARRGQNELARAELQRVRDHPANPEFDAASQMARVYLATYPSKGTDAACQAVQEIIDERFAGTPPGGLTYDLEFAKNKIGFVDYSWKYGPQFVCEPEWATPWPWIGNAKNYLPEMTPQDQEIAHIEKLLFQTGDVSQGLQRLLNLLDDPIIEPYHSSFEEPPRIKLYLLYLLGLAYELSGDEHNAVKTYWQLWRDYPDSPYTLIARRKLAAVGP